MSSISAPGEVTAANCLSFGGTIAGFALGWTSLAADYTVSCVRTLWIPRKSSRTLSAESDLISAFLSFSKQVNFPANSNKAKVFIYTYMGLNAPLIFVEVLGAAAMATFAAKSTWEDAYNNYHLGGLLGAPLIGPMGGFGRFLLVLLALSIVSWSFRPVRRAPKPFPSLSNADDPLCTFLHCISRVQVANNVPNMYSFALTFQAFGKYAQSIPRIFLVILGTGIYVALACAGASSFEDVLDTLLVRFSSSSLSHPFLRLPTMSPAPCAAG